MTLPPEPYSDESSPVTAPGTAARPGALSAARRITEPYRQLAALALLVGNGVFLFLGVSGLLFVIDGRADNFGARSAVQFGDFVGPLALGLPLAAVLLATHVTPVVPQARTILITAAVQYGVSALFGMITFLGAFAHDLFSVRATLEGLLWRAVWLSFLVFAGIVVIRILTGLFPPTAPRRYAVYSPTVYGRPYPGQPLYPQPTYQRGTADPTAVPNRGAGAEAGQAGTPTYSPPSGYTSPPSYPAASGYPDEPNDALFDAPTAESGWPVVPPPPLPMPLMPTPPMPPLAQPAPTQVGPAEAGPAAPSFESDPTMRVMPVTPSLNGDATRLMKPTPPTGRTDSPDGAAASSNDDAPGGTTEPPTRDADQ